MNLSFYGFERSKVALSGAARVGGRLEAQLALSGSTAGGAVAAPPVKFQLLGTADVAGIAPSAIVTTMPPPGAQEADTTKCVYVELTPPDLPWRYTPRPLENGRLRPWVVLVVGSPAEVVAEPDGTVSLAASITADYDLARSSRWAHVQQDDAHSVGRVVSDRKLQPTAEHVAALVPAFRPDGEDAWSAGQPTRVPCYTSWRFRTGTAEDFYDLAKAIDPAVEPQLGSAALTYAPTGSTLVVRGALAGIAGADAPPPAAVSADLRERRRVRGADARGRTLVGLPQYGAAWGALDLAETAGGWRAAVNGDARHRAVAGLGAWCALLEQERIAAAMRARVGAAAVAAQRVAGLALGLTAAGSLWRRRLPALPAERVLLFGPALERLVDGDRTALELVTADDRPWPAALFSTAARRLLRRGTARARLVRSNALDPRAIVGLTNRCPEPRPPEQIRGLPHTVALARFRREAGENPEQDRSSTVSVAIRPARFRTASTGTHSPRSARASSSASARSRAARCRCQPWSPGSTPRSTPAAPERSAGAGCWGRSRASATSRWHHPRRARTSASRRGRSSATGRRSGCCRAPRRSTRMSLRQWRPTARSSTRSSSG